MTARTCCTRRSPAPWASGHDATADAARGLVDQQRVRDRVFERHRRTLVQENLQRCVVESAANSPSAGSSFTLFADTVGVNLEDGGQSTVKKVAAK